MTEPVTIFVYGGSHEENLGGPSIIYGIERALKEAFENPTIYFCVASRVSVDDSSRTGRLRDSDLTILLGAGIRRKTWLKMAALLRLTGRIWERNPEVRTVFEAFKSSDLVIDAWGISFCDKLQWKPGKWILTAAMMTGKIPIQYTSSFGPLRRRRTKRAAKWTLGRVCKIVMCRERQSRDAVLALGLPSEKFIVVPDTGLLMAKEAFDAAGFLGPRGTVGISVSHQIVKQWASGEPYPNVVASVCDKVISEWGVRVVLIPNELNPGTIDDNAIAGEIKALVSRSAEVSVFPSADYSPRQLKHLISSLDILVASRYHSVVAGLSVAVPTLVLGWHYKYEELLAHFGQEEHCVSCEDCTAEKLLQGATRVWKDRDAIRAELSNRIPKVQKLVIDGAREMRRRALRTDLQ